MAVSFHVGIGNWIRILCNKCSSQLRHHSSPSPWTLKPLASVSAPPCLAEVEYLKTQLLYILQSHDIYQIEAGLWSPGRSSCLYKNRGIVLIQRQSFFKANSSLTFLVPFLRTSNRVIRLSWKIPSTRVWKTGLGRLDMNSYFLLHSSDVISPKRLHWLASTSASVPKSWRSDTVNREGHKIKSLGHSLRSHNFNWEESHFDVCGNEL